MPIAFHLHLKPGCTYELRSSFARHWIRNPHRVGDPADFEELVAVLRRHIEREVEGLVREPGVGEWDARCVDRLVKVDPDLLPLRTVGGV